MAKLVDNTGKTHRTALVFDGVRFDSDEVYSERVNRLAQSLNGGNIKTDIFVKRGSTLSRVANDLSDVAGAVDADVSFEDAIALLSDVGYDQILTSQGK